MARVGLNSKQKSVAESNLSQTGPHCPTFSRLRKQGKQLTPPPPPPPPPLPASPSPTPPPFPFSSARAVHSVQAIKGGGWQLAARQLTAFSCSGVNRASLASSRKRKLGSCHWNYLPSGLLMATCTCCKQTGRAFAGLKVLKCKPK